MTPDPGTMAIYKYRLDPWSTGVTMPTEGRGEDTICLHIGLFQL